MKQKLFLLILILTVSLTGFSQNVGFMGKRFLVNADGVFSTAFSNPNMNGNTGFFSYNWMISPNIEVICYKQGTAGAVFNFFQTKSFTYDNDYTFFGKPIYKDSVDINVLGAGVFYKQYLGRNSAAPYGTFVKMQFDWLYYSFYNPLNENRKEQYYLMCLKVEMGKDYLFFNRFRVSWGFSVGFPLYGNENIEDKIFRGDGIFSFKATSAKSRIAYHYLFGFRIGVGFLAF